MQGAPVAEVDREVFAALRPVVLSHLHQRYRLLSLLGSVTVHVHGWVGNDQNIARRIRDELLKVKRRTRPGL